MIVALPPRQAPSASAHQSGSTASPAVPSCWTTGIIVAVYGMLSTNADAIPLTQSRPSVVTAWSPPVSSTRWVPRAAITPVATRPSTSTKRPTKKRSVDQSTSRISSSGSSARHEEEDGRAQEGDGRRLLVDDRREEEAEDRQGQHEQAQAQQAVVGDELRFVDRQDGLPDLRRHGHLAPEDDGHRAGEATKTRMITGVRFSRKSRKVSPLADPMRMFGGSPIRVAVPPMFEASTSARTNGIGREPQRRGDVERDGHEQDDRRHVVEEGAEQGGDRGEQEEDRQRIAARHADRADGQPAEDAGPPQHAGDDHHPEQQEDHVPVDRPEPGLLGDDPEQDDGDGAEQGGQRPVDAIRGDRPVGDDEDREGDPGLHRGGVSPRRRWRRRAPARRGSRSGGRRRRPRTRRRGRAGT